ncbi:DUF4124 domain-containing protein [Acinetobacter sp. C32I]|uniref:DUF4124 domain-containing protein n=1 Tax=Acinetobacter sp. C32I TaxID=2950074 RepID=UPI002036A7F9|nr:DUF4124 domain-containing protein [Acinetobacter sp. C32I]USA52110.1 DUF4124 domain-containing protein [Acinetobacter sp. C32I]
MNLSYLKTILYTTSTAAILLCSSQNYAQQYYKWVDAKGSTHYTTTPPPKGAKRLDKVSTYGNSPQSSNPTTQQGHRANSEATPNVTQQAPQTAPSTPTNTVKPQSQPSAAASSDR